MELCPQCGALSPDGAALCSCGHHFVRARIHPTPSPPDEGRVKALKLSGRRDLRNGTALVVFLTVVTLALFALFDLRPRLFVSLGLFWGVILLIRGFRLRREAWELEHLGFIERERNTAGHRPHP